MAYFPKIYTQNADSPSVDAFGRLRVSTPTTLFDSKQTADTRSILWSDKFTLNASASHTVARASTVLTCSSTVGSTAIRQSKMLAPYQPGKSLLCMTTQVFGPSVAGVRKRVGLFNERNGVFLEDNGGNVNVVMRSSVTGTPVDQVITQSSWNLDTLNGSGSSGINADLTKAQILFFDIQWLGAGRVRAGMEFNGSLTYFHQFNGANVSSSVYMSTPNLPVRYEIANVSAVTNGTFEQICSSLQSEAGYEPTRPIFAADRGITVLSGATNAGLSAVMSMRLKANYTGSFVVPKGGSIFCTTNATNGFRWALLMNPTQGVDGASWVPVLSSSVEYDISRTSAANQLLTGGILLSSGYGNNTLEVALTPEFEWQQLGSTIDGVTDQIVLAVQVVGGTAESFLGNISWKEFS